MMVSGVVYCHSNPQAIITDASTHNVVIAENSSISEGLPVGVKMVLYTFTPNAGFGVFDGKPATRFCRSSGFPSHQETCLYSTEPFDVNAVGKQQEVRFDRWVAVSS